MKNIKRIIKCVYAFIFVFTLCLLTGCGKTTYTVTFNFNDGTTASSTVEIKEGEKASLPNQPYIDDYEFIGWFNNGVEFNFDTAITSDLTLEARFEIDETLAETYLVSFYNDETLYRSIKVKEDRTIDSFDGPKKEGATFEYWTLNGEKFDFTTQIKSNLTIYAKYNYEMIKVNFNVEGKITTKEVEYGKTVEAIENPTKANRVFYYWTKDGEVYDFSTPVKSGFELVAVFGRSENDIIHITYDLGYECYNTKEDLRVAYYTDFYNFLVDSDYKNFEQYQISNVEDFLVFMDTFNWNGRNEMGTIGTAFGTYYVKKDVGGSLENQPETVFLGWCYKNNKYIDFIHHLEVFFEYWRTDEGYSQSDPNGNDFYAEPWASMVDTAKFFYFNGDTLQTRYNGIYKWFDSERVHEALDNIPGVGYVSLVTEEKFDDSVTLPTLTRDGYTFKGWTDDNGNTITEVTTSMTVHANWEEVKESN